MKTTLTLLSLIIAVLTIVSCKKEKNNTDDCIYGTWYLKEDSVINYDMILKITTDDTLRMDIGEGLYFNFHFYTEENKIYQQMEDGNYNDFANYYCSDNELTIDFGTEIVPIITYIRAE